MTTAQIEQSEVRDAAEALLAALEHIADRVRGPNDTLKGDIDRIARMGIAAAESAGIRVKD